MNKAYDVCIVGAGILGLWIARHLAKAGLNTVLVEKETCASGASGGVLGALMPHAPVRWNAKKQFQFLALTELPTLLQELEDETGKPTGYARCGRLMPIRKETFMAKALDRYEHSKTNWWTCDGGFKFGVVKTPPNDNWLAAEKAPLGFVRDELAARVDPVQYMAALQTSLAGRVDIREGWQFGSFDCLNQKVYDASGIQSLSAGQVVLAAGYATFALLEPIVGHMVGSGIKGQAAIFRCPEAIGKPLIYDDGTYIIPHDDGVCAVGSTTEKHWDNPTLPDTSRTDFLDRARALCPPLRNAELLGRWAAVRPHCNLSDPIVGRTEQGSPVLVATGGYKITFGIAERIARCIAEEILDTTERTSLPPTFKPEHHFQMHA